ncbi:MAG: hypothetical protein ACKVHO_25810, partial [Verrucomicrobiia bacterium]
MNNIDAKVIKDFWLTATTRQTAATIISVSVPSHMSCAALRSCLWPGALDQAVDPLVRPIPEFRS